MNNKKGKRKSIEKDRDQNQKKGTEEDLDLESTECKEKALMNASKENIMKERPNKEETRKDLQKRKCMSRKGYKKRPSGKQNKLNGKLIDQRNL